MAKFLKILSIAIMVVAIIGTCFMIIPFQKKIEITLPGSYYSSQGERLGEQVEVAVKGKHLNSLIRKDQFQLDIAVRGQEKEEKWYGKINGEPWDSGSYYLCRYVAVRDGAEQSGFLYLSYDYSQVLICPEDESAPILVATEQGGITPQLFEQYGIQ